MVNITSSPTLICCPPQDRNVIGSVEKFKSSVAALLQEVNELINMGVIHPHVLHTAIPDPTIPRKSLCMICWCCNLLRFDRFTGLDVLDDLFGP
jgi:hypothetical protein